MSASRVQRRVVEPKTDECRALPLGPKFSRCLIENPQCRHAIFVRDKFFCHHPDHRRFEIETA